MLTFRESKTTVPIAYLCDDGDPRHLLKTAYFKEPFDEDEDSEDDSSDEDVRIFRAMKRARYTTKLTAEPGTHFDAAFRPDRRISMFIAGAQNCGKSYFISEILDRYIPMHPERPVYLITGLLEKDKHFERHKNMRAIVMEEENIEMLDLERLRVDPAKGRTGCLLIFDDTDRIRNKKLLKKVYDLLDDALCNGRDHKTQDNVADIDVIVSNHQINDYMRTRQILNECEYVVLFPAYSLQKQLDLALNKIGVSPETKRRIMEYKGRAVVIHKTVPMYCVMKKKVFLLR